MKDQSQSRNGELIAKLQKHISPDRDALLMEVGKISEVMPERMAKWFVMVDDLLRECLTELQSAPSETQRSFEKEPFAWAVKLKSGVESLVYHPIESIGLEPGDVAYPLYRELHTQSQLDAAIAKAVELTKGLRIE